MATSTRITYFTPQTLKAGSLGQDVKFLQQLLINSGYSVGIDGADGDFGSNTEQAVRNFQSNNHLDVDGSVGPHTWYALGIFAAQYP